MERAITANKLSNDDAILYQGDTYTKESIKELYFPEVHGEAERGISPWKGWEPGKYVFVYNNNEENIKIAQLRVIRWKSLNRICVTEVVEVYRHFRDGEWKYIESSKKGFSEKTRKILDWLKVRF